MGSSTDHLSRLADEQAAVRRVATLVAAGAPASELFAAVVEEVVAVLEVPRAWLLRHETDGSVTVVASSDDAAFPVGARIPLDDAHVRSAFGVPIVVEGSQWGLIGIAPTEGRELPGAVEARLHDFTELVATAISSAASRALLHGLADRQASLRSIATLVAEGAPAADLFAAVAQEVVRVLDVAAMAVFRFEPDLATTVVTSLNAPMFPVGSRWPLDGPSLSAQVFRSGRPARIDDYSDLEGTIAEGVRGSGLGSSVGIPIVVDGRVWGMSCVGTKDRGPLPDGIEARLHEFTELVAIAIANAESRDRLRRLAVQQASLRRVATRVAEGAEPADLFSAVAEEVARLLDVSSVSVVRFEPDDSSLVVGSHNNPAFPVGTRSPRNVPGLSATVARTGRPARIDNYRSLSGPVAAAADADGIELGVGAPIIVDGAVWGMVAVGRRGQPGAQPALAAGDSTREIESRLAAFTEIVATAVSKAQAQDDLRRLADEQAALRRVATLVAEGAPADAIFVAVVDEVAGILGLEGIELVRYGDDGTAAVIAASGKHPYVVGSGLTIGEPSVMTSVFRTGAPARIDDYSALTGSIARSVRAAGFRAAIGAPIIVGGRTWGAIVAFSSRLEPVPERFERRLNEFTELVATGVSNATARADLIASRKRIVAAGDEARRRLERNLHDGTQQRLIALGLDLQRLRGTLPAEQRALHAGLEEAERDLASVLEEVRELSHGLHPAQLSRAGLGPPLRALALKAPIPVEVHVDVEPRPPADVETAVYYIVSEAVTNAIKHARAAVVTVDVAGTQEVVRAVIADDGVGGAAPEGGSGLTGLSDRVEALGGRFALESPAGRGTRISIELPVASAVAP